MKNQLFKKVPSLAKLVKMLPKERREKIWQRVKIKPLKAYCIVKKQSPKLDAMSIYSDKDLILEKDEVFVKVEIRVAE